ncbi:MAG: aconitate hydratase AcnA [Vallitaleaceae bacterium]|nr:aconitate hydratase AcnA [Vallitaleaceae bacterium]
MDYNKNQFLDTFYLGGKEYTFTNVTKLRDLGISVDRLPKSIKILLEGALRNYDERLITSDHIEQLTKFGCLDEVKEVGFIPTRIILQDFTGVPAVVDLAAMRNAVDRMGKDPSVINPLVPVDLVIDHSVMVDEYGSDKALAENVRLEFERNQERYRFLKWAQGSFKNFRAVPPSTGIIHQVNLEYLATVVTSKEEDGKTYLFPDTLVGTDSHTTMINGIGILGWGVGGIEAEACMLGQPLYFVTPEVVGVKMIGTMKEGVTATDLALTVTEMLRKHKVVGKFVEYFGEGVSQLSLPDRATVANMSPEYGATMGFFPVDEETLSYMKLSGRSDEQIAVVKEYLVRQGLFGVEDQAEYTTVLELDLSTVKASLAGPKRPQDRVNLDDMKMNFNETLLASVKEGGYGLSKEDLSKEVELIGLLNQDKEPLMLKTGAVVLAAITSCTNTANPSVMIGSGLVAKKAVELGLSTPSFVKTSLTPGSLVVTEYLKKTGLMKSLEALGFHVTGYGCATCIGNSGPLRDEVTKAIVENDLLVGSVLSGNRNFEGRVHQHIKANYLASPMLVVAYALAGRLDIDFENEAIGVGKDGKEVFLRDIWPTNEELRAVVSKAVTKEMYEEQYANIFTANEYWNQIDAPSGMLYEWDQNSTYIREPEFFTELKKLDHISNIEDAAVLACLGDSITTDHISPAGSIAEKSPAGKYLKEMGVERKDFNSYGSRRGNHEVMMRGTFANIRIRNRLANGVEGGVTCIPPSDEVVSIYDAAMEYRAKGSNLIILAGKEYGTGSSRDWAAKGTTLLGVKAVIAESYERIHRSNLVGMGVLPLQFKEGESAEKLGLSGKERFDILDLEFDVKPFKEVRVVFRKQDGQEGEFKAILRLDSVVDIEYYLNKGILQKVLLEL